MAKIGETEYGTLQEAINAVPETGIPIPIEMINNTRECITISGNRNIVLNMDGYVIQGDGNHPAITNGDSESYIQPELTIVDYGVHQNTTHYFKTDTEESSPTKGLWKYLGEEAEDFSIGCPVGGLITCGKPGIVSYGVLTMDAGNIVGNNSLEEGGGIVVKKGTLTMNNAIIRGNLTTKKYGGVYVSDDAQLIIGNGIVTISGNKANEATASNEVNLYAENIFHSFAGEDLVKTRVYEYDFAIDGPREDTLEPGNYILINEVFNQDNPLFISEKSKRENPVRICLNGNILANGNSSATIYDYGHLSLYDSTGKGDVRGGHVNVYIDQNASFDLYGGTISSSNGTEEVPYGGGVSISEGGDFTMYGGHIARNFNILGGGGVYVAKNASFTMLGGDITHNSVSEMENGKGAGIYVANGGTATIGNDVLIADNDLNTTIPLNDVYVENGGVFRISDTYPLKDGALIGLIRSPDSDTFTVSGLKEGDSKYFRSDDPEYTIYQEPGSKDTLKFGKSSEYGYTITYRSGMSDAGLAPVDYHIYRASGEESSKLTENPGTLTFQCHQAIAWNTSYMSTEGTSYPFGSTIMNVTSNMLLYPKYVEGSLLTLNSGDTKVAGSAVIKRQDTKFILFTPPQRSGYKVDGYYADIDLSERRKVADAEGNILPTTVINFTKDGKWDSNGSQTLYPKWVVDPQKSESSGGTSVTAFSALKNGDTFTFSRSNVVTTAALPGASSARIINTNGEGWYNFNLTADGFTGNGSMNFQVPLDVLQVKGVTVNDVGLYHQENGGWVLKPTTYLKSDNQYAYYKATFDSCSPFKIDFAAGSTNQGSKETKMEESIVGDTQGYLKITSAPVGATIQIEGVNYKGITPQSKIALNPGTYTVTLNLDGYNDASTSFTITSGETTPVTLTMEKTAAETKKAEQTAAKSPFPVLGVLIGLCAGALMLKRRQ